MRILKEYAIGGVTISTKLKPLEGLYKERFKVIEDTGLINLMKDYNLTWKSVYEIVKEAIEKGVEE